MSNKRTPKKIASDMMNLPKRDLADVWMEKFTDVQKWILLGVPKKEIIDSIMLKYDVSESAADKFIHQVEEHIARGANKTREQYIREMIISYNDMYDECRRKGLYSEARAIKAQLSKLLGLDAPTKVDVNGQVEYIKINIDLKQLKEFKDPDDITAEEI